MPETIFGLTIDPRNTEQVAEVLTAAEPARGVQLVCTVNVDHVVNMGKSAEFQAAYQSAHMVTVDGGPIYLYATLKGLRLNGRVTGSDLFPAIMHRLDPLYHRPVFLTSRQAVADSITEILRQRGFTEHSYAAVTPPFGFDTDPLETQELLRLVRELRATHLFMGVGSPKSEIWVDRHREQLGNLYAFGFGAALEYYTGVSQRAPVLLQRIGLEWVWRLASEPRRLARRYLVNSWGLLGAVTRDLLKTSQR